MPLRLLVSLILLLTVSTPVLVASPVHADGWWDRTPTEGVWPLAPTPEVVAGFDPPAVRWGRGHRGVDLQGRLGQPVRTSLAGTVSFSGRIAGRGVVVIDHGATRTTYEPVTGSVSRGDRVGRGDVLGRLTLFGSHCFPRTCLHWGLRRGDVYENPLTLVGGGPVRLLPLAGSPRLSDLLSSGPAQSPPVQVPVGPMAGSAALFRSVSGARMGLAIGPP